MKSKTYLFSEILDDDCYRIDINGPSDEVLELLEAQAVAVFKAIKDSGRLDSMDLFCFSLRTLPRRCLTLTFERIYELAIEAASARVNDLSSRRRTRDSVILKRWHEQAIAELSDLGRGYNQMIIDKYKEMARNGNA